MIKFACGNCGKKLRAADSQGGENRRCTKCGLVISIPFPAHEGSAEGGPIDTLDVETTTKRYSACPTETPCRPSATHVVAEAAIKSLDVEQTMLPPQSHVSPNSQNSVEQGVLPIGHSFDGKFVITKILGQGGLGIVYRAIDTTTHVEYAIKVLRPEWAASASALATLRFEVAKAQSLTHQNLLKINCFVDAGPMPYLLMEYVEGENLEEYRRRKGGKLPEDDFRKIAAQVLTGLAYVHSKGIVHCDVKPQNFMVTPHGEVKLIDYGIARSVKEQLAQENQSRRSAGSLAYMAPEQLRGQACSSAADVYSVALMFFRLTSGRFPFDETSPSAIVEWHLDDQHRAPESDIGSIDSVLSKALAVDPLDRYPSCEDLAKALKPRKRSKSKERHAVLASVAKTNPDSADVHRQRGDDCVENKGDFDGAIRHYNEAIRIDPDDPEAFNGRGVAFSNKQQYRQAIEDYTEAIRRDPTNPAFYFNRACTLKREGEDGRAIADYTDAIKLSPDDARFFNGRGGALSNKQQYRLAIDDFTEAIRRDPTKPDFYLNRAHALEREGEYHRAIADFTEAIKLRPDDPKAFAQRGGAFFEKKQYRLAIGDFTEAIRRDPTNPDFYSYRALVLLKCEGEYHRAIADFTDAIKLRPDDPVAFNGRGLAFVEKQQYRLAIDDFTEAIRRDPTNPAFYSNRAHALECEGEYDRAKADYGMTQK